MKKNINTTLLLAAILLGIIADYYYTSHSRAADQEVDLRVQYTHDYQLHPTPE